MSTNAGPADTQAPDMVPSNYALIYRNNQKAGISSETTLSIFNKTENAIFTSALPALDNRLNHKKC